MKIKTLTLGLCVGLFLSACATPQSSRRIAAENTSVSANYPAPGVYIGSENPVIALLYAAQNSIDIEIYTMGDPGVLQALRDALTRHVKVRVIEDPSPAAMVCDVFGQASQDPDCASQQKLVQEVNQAGTPEGRAPGSTFIPFDKTKLCAKPGGRCFEHGKIVIADQKIILISTGNFDKENLCDVKAGTDFCTRDYNVVTDDSDVIKSLSTVFSNDLAGIKLTSDLLATLSPEKITASPFSRAPLEAFFQKATTLRIQEQYLNDNDFNQAIVNLMPSKTSAVPVPSVFINVASPCSIPMTPPLTQVADKDKAAVTTTYSSFDQAKIQTRMFSKNQKIGGQNGYLHAKVIVVNDQKAWVGSVNGSSTSLDNNREYGIFIDNKDWVSKIIGQMKADFSDPQAETWQESLNCAKDL